MKCLKCLVWAGTVLVAGSLFAEADGPAVGEIEVRLKGPLGARLDRMIERHVTDRDVDYITDCFREKTERKGWWQTEFWGKYMHAAVPYLGYCGSEKLRAAIERGIDRILASQETNGYIGNYPDELRCGEGWDVWGMKYTLMGLLHYYDGSRGKSRAEVERGDAALTAACRLCDYVIAEIGPKGRRGRELWQTGNWSGYASSSILEPVVWLSRRVRPRDDFGGQAAARKYLDFAAFLVEGMTKPPQGPRLLDLALKGVSVADRNERDFKNATDWRYVCKYGRSKAYEMMSCYQGILDYVEEKAKCEGEGEELERLRKAAVMTAEDIVREEVNLAGGCACSEAWFHGARRQHLPHTHLQETCVTTTWMRFCEKLLETTGNAKWADQIERTFYNAYLGALRPDGSEFAAYTPLTGSRWHGMHHCFMHTDCCTANGPRGFLCFLRKLVTRTDDTTTFNFYATARVPGFDMYSLYPRNGFVRIVSHTTGPRTVRLRVPGWCPKMQVTLNEQAVPDKASSGYVSVKNDWKLGDIVEIRLDLPVVAHVIDHSVAFTRGPVLLARDSRFGDGDLTEPYRIGSMKDGATVEGVVSVATGTDDLWMAFSATMPLGSHSENPEAQNATAVRFCDYSSAGNLWRRDNYYRTWFPIEYGNTEY